MTELTRVWSALLASEARCKMWPALERDSKPDTNYVGMCTHVPKRYNDISQARLL